MKPLRACCAAALAALIPAAHPALDVAGVERGADPCLDFYAFANKRWLDTTPIPADRTLWGSFDLLGENAARTLERALASALAKPLPPEGTARRKVLDYYASGMDEADIARAPLEPINRYLGAIRIVDGAEPLARILAELHARGIRPGFTFDVRADAKDSTRYLAGIAQGGLGLPDRDYYFLDDARTRAIREAYRIHIARVLELNGDTAAQGLGQIYVYEAFPPEAKVRLQRLVQDIKEALRERLKAVDWMSEETRALSLAKLDAMKVKIGYPDKWRDFSRAGVGARPFVENWMSANRFAHLRDVARIGQPVDRDEWRTSPHIVNAFYSSANNEIVFPAAILQPPFFDAKADDAVNYGGIGMVIGHEITHGFDDRGRRFDKDGNLRDWWTPEDDRRYRERAKKVESQYAAYSGIDGIKVNGALTLGENISDIGGLKIAYLALRKALADRPQGPIDGFTPEQRFFLSFANVWRAQMRPEQERVRLRTDPHSLPALRVRGVVANMPEFARAFSCDAARTLLPEAERGNIW